MHHVNMRSTCLSAHSPDGKHHWMPFKKKNVLGAPIHAHNFGRVVVSAVRIRITCRYCLFRTIAIVDRESGEVRINT
jgi:hypothetical protein